VRNIVSDADKIEAIGLRGVIRCRDYVIEKNSKRLSDGTITKYVWHHARVKLLHLYKNYIHTDSGKKIAKPLHEEMIKWFLDNGINGESLSRYK